MDDKKYNGWSNYATWRIKLELWDNDSMWEDREYTSITDFADDIKDTTENILTEQAGKDSQIVLDYALAFIADVNWYEIAEHIAEDYPNIIKN